MARQDYVHSFEQKMKMKFQSAKPGFEKREIFLAGIFFILIFSSVIIYYHASGFPDLCAGDEALTALRTQGLMDKGHGWTPYWCGAPDLHKPPLYFWLAALSCKFFGCKVSALRLPSVLSLFLLMIFIYLLALEIFQDRLSGYLSVLLLTFNPIVLEQSRIATLDTLMVALNVGALYFLLKAAEKEHFYYFWSVFCGLAILTKGEGATPVVVVSFMYLLTVRRKAFLSRAFYLSLFLGMLLPATWFISQYLRHPHMFIRFHYKDFVSYRFKHKEMFLFQRPLSWTWYSWNPLSFILFSSPVLSFLLGKRGNENQERKRFILIFDLLIPFFMISLVRQQEVWYIFPIIPPMALFAGDVISNLAMRARTKSTVSLLGIFLAVGCWFAGGNPGHHLSPHFKEFLRYLILFVALIFSSVVVKVYDKRKRFFGIFLVILISSAFIGINAPKFRRTALAYMHRKAALWKTIGLELRGLKKVDTPIVVNFRFFPRNVIMFYAHYDSMQLRRFSHKVIPPGEVYYGVLLMVPTCWQFLRGLKVDRIRRYPYKLPIDLLRMENISSHPIVPFTGRPPSPMGRTPRDSVLIPYFSEKDSTQRLS